MIDDDLDQDDLDITEDDETESLESVAEEEEVAAADDGDDDEVVVSSASSRSSKSRTIDEEALPSVEAKQKERDELAKAMEAFLARGGQVQEIESNS
ncbi:hypothetical protein VQ643_12225 [Pseudomonas sp. F1_0610]|uniref:hypothetical protein n=1 Tax=Pseudomonas sp. F1_0610 TaxID=3114284 RepID=UPI0039C01C90